MSEAPKKIWLSRYMNWDDRKQADGDIGYIREDLVDELYAALEITAELVEALGHTAKKARAALTKIKEEK